MRYIIPSGSTGYFPEVLSVLMSLDDEKLFFEDKNLSHPTDLFLLAFNDVIECITNITEKLHQSTKETKITAKPPTNIGEFKILTFNLLFYTANFIEACQSIIKSLFKDGGNNKEFTKAVRDFKESIKSYHDHTSKIINLIKHQHRRVCPFSATWSNNLIVGYFIEGLVAPATIGPDPQIHKNYKGCLTGISLNYEINYHLANIYFCAYSLASIIKKYSPGKTIGTEIKTNIDDSAIKKCFELVSSIDLLLLPNEFLLPSPFLLKNNDNKYTIEMPGSLKPKNRKPHILNISLTSRIGIRNRSIALPYFIEKSTSIL